MSPFARVLSALVTVYRYTVSPLLGPRCRYEPSCSQYALEALREHGAARAATLGAATVMTRCRTRIRITPSPALLSIDSRSWNNATSLSPSPSPSRF